MHAIISLSKSLNLKRIDLTNELKPFFYSFCNHNISVGCSTSAEADVSSLYNDNSCSLYIFVKFIKVYVAHSDKIDK